MDWGLGAWDGVNAKRESWSSSIFTKWSASAMLRFEAQAILKPVQSLKTLHPQITQRLSIPGFGKHAGDLHMTVRILGDFSQLGKKGAI